MSKLRKLAAILLSATMFVCAFGIQASAAATTIKGGKAYSTTLKKSGSAAEYKVTSSTAGVLSIKINARMYQTLVYVYDSNNRLLEDPLLETTSGESHWEHNDKYVSNIWNQQTKKFIGSIKYNITKGTYRIRFERYSLDSSKDKGTGKLTFAVTVPSDYALLTGIAVPMKVGGTMQLTPLASAKITGTVKWSSSKSSIVSVNSKGKITAKKKGTAVITAKYGSNSVQLNVIVS